VLIWGHPVFLTPYNSVKNMQLKGLESITGEIGVTSSKRVTIDSHEFNTKLDAYFYTISTTWHYRTIQ
jgi:hypothetical protein